MISTKKFKKMTTQEKIILATENPNKAYLALINSVEDNREFNKIVKKIMSGTYTTEKFLIASSTALVNLILNKIV